jgi:hypothetical protein
MKKENSVTSATDASCFVCGNAIGHELDCPNHPANRPEVWSSPAQTTPEGGRELPPLPKNFGLFNIDGPDGHRIKGYTADQMRDYARAAFSATQQAEEPVAYMFDVHCPRLGQRRQFAAIDYDLQADERLVAKMPLYDRAAPLQQEE